MAGTGDSVVMRGRRGAGMMLIQMYVPAPFAPPCSRPSSLAARQTRLAAAHQLTSPNPPPSSTDEGAQYRWPPKDPTKNGWTAEAPPLFAPPGAASTSPFTYGSGFNPSLVPSNSVGLRQRTYPSHHYQQEEEREGEAEGETSSDSDDEIVQPRQRMMAEPDADQLAALDGYDDYPREAHQYQYEDQIDDDEGEEAEYNDEEDEGGYDPQPRVMVRRGSEGYEVRPRAGWIV